MKPTKVLAGFLMDGKAGGVDRYLLNFFQQVHSPQIQIDFLTNHIDSDLQTYLNEHGSKLYEVANLRQPQLQYRQICDLIQTHQYNATYFNLSTAISRIGPKAAYDCKVPIRVIHSHSTGTDCSNPIKRALFNYLHNKYKKQLYRMGNRFYACSKIAGLWLFPEKIVESNRFHIIHNAIDVEKFLYNSQSRTEIRKILGLDDCFVVGHVSNFCYPKNSLFLFSVFAQLAQQNPQARLLLVGTGPHLAEIQEAAAAQGLQDKVLFLGHRCDVPQLLQAMDVFLFPSLFEGLGMALIEAQAAGLPCVTSTAVPREVAVTNLVTFLPLSERIQVWVDAVADAQNAFRANQSAAIYKAGYDLQSETDAYLSIIT